MSSKPRRVLVLCRNFPPEVSASSFCLLRWAKYLPAAGWQPCFLAISDDWDYAGRDPGLAAEVPAGIEIERVSSWSPEERFDRYFKRGRFATRRPVEPSTPVPRRSSVCSLLKDLLRPIWALGLRTPDPSIWWLAPGVRRGLELARRRRISAVLSVGPPHSLHLAGARLKRLTGLPLVVDLQDPWAVPSFGEDRNPLGRRLLARFEARVFKLADRVVLNTPRAEAFYAGRYPRLRSKLAVIANGFDPAYRPPEAGARTGDPHSLLLCHPGALYGARDVRPLLEALAGLVEEGLDIRFEQVGVHDPRFDLPAAIAAYRLAGRVELLSRRSHAEVLERMRAADLFLVAQPGAPLQVPCKTYEMMLFDKPILALTGDGATADLIREHDLGAVADAGDVAAIRRALRRLAARLSAPAAATPDRRARRKAPERLDGRFLARELASILDGLTYGDDR